MRALAWRLLGNANSSKGLARAAVSSIRILEDDPNDRLDAAIRARLDIKPDIYLEIERHNLAGDIDAAITVIRNGYQSGSIAPDDLALWRRSARTLLVRGNIGRDAEILHRAHVVLPKNDRISQRISWLDDALRAEGMSLSSLAQSTSDADSTGPTAIGLAARQVARCPVIADPENRQGIVMLGGSLACGGAERIMANCYRQLVDSHEYDPVNLWLMQFSNKNDGPDYRFYLDETGASEADIVEVDETEVRDPEPALRSAPRLYAKRASALTSMLRERRPAALHCWLDQCCLIGGLAGILADVPRIILHTHGLRPTRFMTAEATTGWAQAYATLLARPEIRLVNCSEAGLIDYLDWISCRRGSNSKAILNGIDFEPFRSLPSIDARMAMREKMGIPFNAPIVGTAFRFSSVKQPELWLRAAAHIHEQRPEVHFLMFGDGELRPACQNLAEALGIAEYVHMPGQVSDLADKLPLFDLFMLSSASEGLPNVLIEAQAAKVPVISFDVGGVSEAMMPGKSGELVADHSAAALADAALQWLSRNWLRRLAGWRGRRFVHKTFSMQSMIDQIGKELKG
ncbi:glycosyltransferase [Parasphingopyxis sp. CP4]|uniref:glycosyltransferase n=1 Tax=Parasphingopyxis sp. CP4 TaxID=2724527 RepID=UPI0015A0132A|nr:glycosyltransferase [Parasphingopyxis sp. CP4]QLC21241.1 glycosyltransferase [Parasphingopyxis sp. CP4]